MKRVDAKEFAEHAAEYLAAGEPISVEQDGDVIGRYLPIPHVANGTATNGHATHSAVTSGRDSKVDPEKHADMEWISSRLQEIYDATGLTEDEFADLFDTKKPFPFDNLAKP